MKIMIVDDHAAIRRFIKNIILNYSGNKVEITECESGEEAVEQYNLFKPNWVFMDIEMENMTEFEATDKIKKLDPKAKVVIVTSHDKPLFRRKAKELSVEGFITKDNLLDITPLLENMNNV